MTEENPLQASMERSAKLSEVFFPAPPRALSYVVILLASAATAVVQGASIETAVDASWLVLLPAVLAATLCPSMTSGFGRTFVHRRSAFLATIGAVIVAAGALAAALLSPVGVDGVKVLYLAVGILWVVRYGAVSVVADSRMGPALAISGVQPIATLPALLALGGNEHLLAGALLWLALMLPLVLMIRVFDTPLQRNFGISASQVFRAFLDHMTTHSTEAEELMTLIGEPAQVPVSVITFRRKDGSAKACIVVPAVHPGPFGRLGGGDLPAKMRQALSEWDHVLVPHAAANHDMNPVSSDEVERLGLYAAELARDAPSSSGGTRFVEVGEEVHMGAQRFGDDLLLTYTSWPEAIDDVDYGIGHAAELVAVAKGNARAVFVDCHNSLRPAAGAVFPLTPRALEIERRAAEAAEGVLSQQVDTLRVGCAQDRSLGTSHLIGRAGCQALVVEAGEQRTAYLLWDGNNMIPEATRAVRDAALEVVDQVRVMTTDNHAVNLEGGVFSPVGLRVSPERLATIGRRTIERAIEDLEPVDAGGDQGHAPDVIVVGHQKTAQLSASVNTMVSSAPELVVATVGLWVLGVTVVFLTL